MHHRHWRCVVFGFLCFFLSAIWSLTAPAPTHAGACSEKRVSPQFAPRTGSGAGRQADESITCGQTISGTLDQNDPDIFDDGTFADRYTFTLTEATTVTFTMTPTGFAEYLFVGDTEGNPVFNGRSPVGGTLPPGDYEVIANNFEVLDGSYPYELSMSCAEPPPAIACDQTIHGTLDQNDPDLFGDGTFADPYRFTLTEYTQVTFSLTAAGFEPYLYISDSEGVLFDGSSPQSGTLPPGDYEVIANNLEPLPDGSYPYELMMSCTSAVANIACGQIISGALDPDDPDYFLDGTFTDLYRFRLRTETTLTFTMSATEFEEYLYVADTADNRLFDGASPQEGTLPPGDYLIAVNNFEALPEGSYPYELTMACVTDCPGDCDGNGLVTVSDLIFGVGIAVEDSGTDECSALDTNANGHAEVNELVGAVGAALHGCPAD